MKRDDTTLNLIMDLQAIIDRQRELLVELRTVGGLMKDRIVYLATQLGYEEGRWDPRWPAWGHAGYIDAVLKKDS